MKSLYDTDQKSMVLLLNCSPNCLPKEESLFRPSLPSKCVQFHLFHHNKIPSKRFIISSRETIVNASGNKGASPATAVCNTMVLSNGIGRIL